MTDLAEALRIARALAKIATCMDAPKEGSIGTLVAELDTLEERIERERRDKEAAAREERAYERGEHEAREEARQEKAAKMREWDIALGNLMPAVALAFFLLLAMPTHATLPQDAVVLYLKTAKVTLKKQVRDPATGTIKEVLIGRYVSTYEAKEAMRLLPPLKGGLLYRIDVPPAYANVIECIVPPTQGICTDAIDYRLHFVP